MESRNIILAILIAAIALGVFYMLDPTFGGLMRRKFEGFENDDSMIPNEEDAAPSMSGMMPDMFSNSGETDLENEMENTHVMGMDAGVEATEGFESLAPAPMPFAGAEKPANCYPKNQLAPQELLPNDPNSKWSQVNPMGAGDIAGKNFLNAAALIGVDTVGQSNRNASWDIRSLPANPQVQVSPWMQSTIEPDLVRRPLE
jgi:hypothetical protein